MDAVFDTQALKQASELPWPSEFREQSRLWAQNSSDLAAAAEYIEELEAEVARLRGES
jgi:hypothetical protein